MADSSSFDIGQLLSQLGLAGLDIWSLIGKKPQTAASTAQQIADPFGSQYGKYQPMLEQFMTDPNYIFKDPAFIAAERQGEGAVTRAMSAGGFKNSGNILAELQKYGETFALPFQQEKFRELASLSGVGAGSPGTAAQIYLGGQQGQQATIADLLKQILGGGGVTGGSSILQAFLKLIGGGGMAPGGGIDWGANQGPNWSGEANPDPFYPPGGYEGVVSGGGFDPFTPVPMPDLTELFNPVAGV